MFQVGNLICYGSTGVCEVKEIKKMDGEKKGVKRDYYVLKPLYQTCVITTPADNPKVFMRPIISREEAEKLIDSIPDMQTEEYHSRVIRDLSEHYQASFQTHNCEDLLELTMSIYSKKRTLERQKKKFGVIDERYMKRGEDLLFGELAAALDIPRDDVQTYIAQRLKQNKTIQ